MNNWGRLNRCTAAVALVLLYADRTVAQESTLRWWVGGSGNWDDASHWSLTKNGKGGAGKPKAGESVEFRFGDSVNRQVTINATTPALYGIYPDSTGAGTMTLRMTGGTLNAGDLFIASQGKAAFVQTAGTLNARILYIGQGEHSAGRFTLAGGTLNVAELTSLGAFDGTPSRFVQTGGTFNTGRSVGLSTGSTWDLSAGQLVADALRVEGGVFTQTGGAVKVRQLLISPSGEAEPVPLYLWKGGSLSVSESFSLDGRMTFPTTPVSLNVNGLVDFEHATFANAQNVSLNLGPNAILNYATPPAASFGKYRNAGLAHQAGTTLTIPGGRRFAVSGRIADPVDVYGTLTDTDSGFLALESEFTVRPGALLALSSLEQWNGPASRILGGTVRAGRVQVRGRRPFFPRPGTPSPPPAMISQSGGRVEIPSLVVGWDGGGEYELSGGRLTTDSVTVAPGLIASFPHPAGLPGSSGRITQTGGRLTVNHELRLGEGPGTDATYTLAGGTLRAASLLVGYDVVWPPDGFLSIIPPGRGVGHFAITSFASRLEVTSRLEVGPGSTFKAVPGAAAHLINADFRNLSTTASDLSGLELLRMVFEGGTTHHSILEVAGRDRGAGPAGFADNFLIDTLTVGGVTPAWLKLADAFDNQPGSPGAESLYVRHLVITPGSTLDLGGLHLYAQDVANGGTLVPQGGQLILAASGAAQPIAVPEPAALGALALAAALGGRHRRSTAR